MRLTSHMWQSFGLLLATTYCSYPTCATEILKYLAPNQLTSLLKLK
jgi:hypothetical protein